MFDRGNRVIEPKDLPVYSERIYKHSYIDSRVDLDYDTVEVIESKRFDDYVIFPIRMSGVLVGWCGRYVGVKKTKRKYYNCPCLLYTSPSPRDRQKSRMPSSA